MTVSSLPPRWPSIQVALICASILLSGASACTSLPAESPPAVGILIEFREPVDGAAPELLSRLQRRSGALSIHYLAPTSPKLHAYQITCTDDPTCTAAIRALHNDPAVLDISPNRLRNPH